MTLEVSLPWWSDWHHTWHRNWPEEDYLVRRYGSVAVPPAKMVGPWQIKLRRSQRSIALLSGFHSHSFGIEPIDDLP